MSPNQRLHWSKLARAKKAYREACAWTAKEQGARPMKADKLHLSLVFYPPQHVCQKHKQATPEVEQGRSIWLNKKG